MKLALLAASAIALASSIGCAAPASNDDASADQDLTGSLALGTYVIDSRPWFSAYASRLTLSSGKKFEIEMVADGETTLFAGTYAVLPARPNDPASPIQTDKPTLYLTPDSGEAPLTFEFDKLAGGEVRLYRSARSVTFTMKLDPSYAPPATNAKTIACTGPAVDALITLDQAQNRRGTLKITRKSGADDRDPPNATVSITRTEGSAVPGYLYFEGSQGEQDYYVNMIEADFDRGRGAVTAHLMWAEGGEELSIGATCKFQ